MGKYRNNKPVRKDMLLRIGRQQVPTRIYIENRDNVRASLGKKRAILRMPNHLPLAEQQEMLDSFEEWVSERLKNCEAFYSHFVLRDYKDGDQLTVGKRTYQLQIRKEDRKTSTARVLPGSVIALTLSQQHAEHELSKVMQHLLSRAVARDFLPEITERVHRLNDEYFRQPIGKVSLKYNHSNFGSCSEKGNINLSTRLLFAPDEIIDYVIIHELAHRIEMNHSPRFWKLVAKAMPNYKQQEAWLKEHSSKLTF